MENFNLSFFLLSFSSLFTLINPIGITPIILSISENMNSVEYTRIIRKGIVTAYLVLFVFTLMGDLIFKFYGNLNFGSFLLTHPVYIRQIYLGKEEHKHHGFSNDNELIAFRFMDFALGEFFRVAKEEDYYDNTIFVILGDHGIGHPSQKNNFGALSLHNFHVPLAIFSPGLNIKPRTINLTSSSIDLLPTIMGLLSVPYKNTTLGIDLLNYNLNKRYAFIFTATNFTYGLITNKYFITSNVMGEQIAYDVINNNYITKYNSEINYMMELNKGYYHISKYLRYHNE